MIKHFICMNIIRQTHDRTYLEYPWLKSLKLSKRIVSHHVLVQGELFKHSLMRVNSMITIVTLLNPPPIVKMESTLLTQIVRVLMQKDAKSAHYLSGFPLFLRVVPPPTLDGGTSNPRWRHIAPPRSKDTHQTHKCQSPFLQNQLYKCEDIVTWSRLYYFSTHFERTHTSQFQVNIKTLTPII